ncbi:uncharacterized protein IWZ02DRAFT_113136 [Phyllosticta citriasiana]|uniref:uncharacterized protein n=1 Tax=Phyllosticta citriasiana TaxID=595635 RepID=UPI0030FD8F35
MSSSAFWPRTTQKSPLWGALLTLLFMRLVVVPELTVEFDLELDVSVHALFALGLCPTLPAFEVGTTIQCLDMLRHFYPLLWVLANLVPLIACTGPRREKRSIRNPIPRI